MNKCGMRWIPIHRGRWVDSYLECELELGHAAINHKHGKFRWLNIASKERTKYEVEYAN